MHVQRVCLLCVSGSTQRQPRYQNTCQTLTNSHWSGSCQVSPPRAAAACRPDGDEGLGGSQQHARKLVVAMSSLYNMRAACVLLAAMMQASHPLGFVVPAPRSMFPSGSSEAQGKIRARARQDCRPSTSIFSSAKPQSSRPDRREQPFAASKGAKPNNNGSGGRTRNGTKKTPRGSRSPASAKRERSPIDPSAPDPPGPDVHVLVPVKDVVAVPLTDISQAAADSLGGGEAVRVPMERFCKTLESVFRTEFSVKVDRANAGLVLGGRRYGNIATRAARGAASTGTALRIARRSVSKENDASGDDGSGDKEGGVKSLAGPGGSGSTKRSRWRRGRWQQGNKKGVASGGGEQKEGRTAAAAAGVGKARKPVDGVKRRKGDLVDDEAAAEEECVPLLELVEELVRNAMFSPISYRDVMMSQALAAEFPSAARVRPVFGNLANVYDLLHHLPDKENAQVDGGRRAKGGDGEKEVVRVPFEGRLLVFRRGNGVEETKGRLLLKKLDYLQSNAVGWLSQSVTDTIKGYQEAAVSTIDAGVRRKDGLLNSCVEGAIAFGLERDTLARFLPVANETELAVREQEAIDEALGALRSSARRGPVSLQRYGTRSVNIKLEEFSEGGAWPPGDDSWFWGSRNATGTGRAGVLDAGTIEGNQVPSAVLPRVTLASVLGPRPVSNELTGGLPRTKNARRSETERRSVLSRLLSRCTVKEPTYDEVVVVYYKRARRSRFRPPPALSFVWKIGTKVSNRIRGVEKFDVDPESSKDVKGAGLGLQLRVYRRVPLVSLNAIAPDKKVEVRPQTALRLDLNTIIGLGLVLANLRFDSPVLVVAATASVILLVVRTVVGYLNARVRVESFVSRDILDKTMGSNVPVLRHLAEEAAQQKSRHVALVYAALLQCALNNMSEEEGSGGELSEEKGSLTAVSMAAISRHCRTMMKACDGVPWEAEVDLPHWLTELEKLKVLIRVDAERDIGDETIETPRWLPLALERPDMTAETPKPRPRPTDDAVTLDASAPPRTSLASTVEEAGSVDSGGSDILFYRVLDPEAGVEELKQRWSELVEPPGATAEEKTDGIDSGGAVESPPWARRLGRRSTDDGGIGNSTVGDGGNSL